MMGRPSKNNPEWKQKKQAREEAKAKWKIQKFLDAMKWGLNRDTAISYAWLSRASVYARMKDNENFKTQVEDAEEYRFAIVESEKNKQIRNGYRPAIEKELKSKKRAIYGDKIETDNKTEIDWEIIIKLPK